MQHKQVEEDDKQNRKDQHVIRFILASSNPLLYPESALVQILTLDSVKLLPLFNIIKNILCLC